MPGTQHLLSGGDEAGIAVGVVGPSPRMRCEQGYVVLAMTGSPEEWRTALALAIPHRVWQRPVAALRKKHHAQHGQNGEGGKDHVMQEKTTAVVDVHEGGGSPAHHTGCQDEA